jgi:hypothetical protein
MVDATIAIVAKRKPTPASAKCWIVANPKARSDDVGW